MILKSTTEVIRLITSASGSVDVQANFADHSSTAFAPSSLNTKITTATTTTIIGSPAASVQRQIKNIMIHNISTTVSNSIQVELFDGTNAFKVYNLSLSPDEHCLYNGSEWLKYSPSGVLVQQSQGNVLGESRSIYKIGTAPEAAGNFYCFSKDSGFPGAWSVGTPGLAGRVCDGTTAGDAGCISAGTPVSGAWHIRDLTIGSTQPAKVSILDFLWVNSGIVVTTTTAQTINSVTLPARDNNGTTNGEGVQVGILVTTATTNAGIIANTTMSYTNSDGVAGRTATISAFPITAVIGTLVKFQLQAGDKGVRSIQSVTLGTSYVAGAVSLVAFEQLVSVPSLLANAGSMAYAKVLDVPLYNGHCLIPIIQANGATATTIDGDILFVNK